MEVVVILPITKIDVQERNGKTYYNALSEQALFDANGEKVSSQKQTVGIDEDHLSAVTKAIQDAKGAPVALSVRTFAVTGRGGRPFVTYFAGRLWNGALG